MPKTEYTKDVAFINREPELRFLSEFLKERPESILFIYGPKSGGKTSLLYRLTDIVNCEKKYVLKPLNLRETWIGSYKDFIKAFFNVTEETNIKTKSKYEISAGVFKINREVEQKLLKAEADPFKVMKQDLMKINKSGRQTLIIIDELQKLRHIYMNGQRHLINELFNFFVAMTKESHLAHIFISTSDGYFIETIYDDSRLRKTSKFYKIDYLTKNDVLEWLSNLELYSKIKNVILTEEQKEEIWDLLGGSCWEIQSLLSDILIYDYKTAMNKSKKEKKSEIINCINKDLERKKIIILFHNKKNLTKEDIFNSSGIEFKKLEAMLSDLVTENVLFFDPLEASFSPQSKSTEYGIKKYFETAL